MQTYICTYIILFNYITLINLSLTLTLTLTLSHSLSLSHAGLNTSLVPMYISEIAPLNLRGGLGTVNQLAVTIGLLLSQVLGIEQILGTNDGWPVLLGLAICPAILQLMLLPVCPESPRYLLITKQWEEEARSGKFFSWYNKKK